MKIVIAPDSYKESLSASEVAQAIEKGFREIFPDAQYVSVPVADGGEGNGWNDDCRPPRFETSRAGYSGAGREVNCQLRGFSGDAKTAFMKCVRASGLSWVPAEKQRSTRDHSRGHSRVNPAGGWRAARQTLLSAIGGL
ncbi:glycerate kinase [Escherichia coli]|nr:glycerate kinase [Escherichia coli]